MFGYRRIEVVDVGKIVCNDPGDPPEFLLLRPDQLVVNEEYQRSLSKASLEMIKAAAHEFDWDSYKALNVAKTDHPDVYEVVDGQHTAIAAKTNGRVPFLPCLLQRGTTLRDKARGFLGINTKRIAMTPVSIFHAQVAAQDDAAIAVENAMSRAGAKLLPIAHMDRRKYAVGETIAVGTMMSVAKKNGDARLSIVLRVAVLAKAAPISSILIKALNEVVPLESTEADRKAIVEALIKQGIGRLEVVSSADTEAGGRSFEVMADKIADAAGLPRMRRGKPMEPKRIRR